MKQRKEQNEWINELEGFRKHQLIKMNNLRCLWISIQNGTITVL